MKRTLLVALLVGALAAAAAAIVLSGKTSSGYRVDVVFDDARGLVAGQLLEIAGGRAGTIQAVTLTDRYRRARVELDVDPRFAPFRTTATCTIRPQGLIAENYVACDPGKPSARPLSGHPPTVPVSHTTEPVTLTDLFNIATVPTRDRLTVLLDELGVGTAARGDDINAIIRRANPTLALAQRAIAILQGQSAQLTATIDATDPVVAQLASHRTDVRRFVGEAATVSTRLAQHRAALGAGVQRLPALLAATRPALRQLDAVTTQGTPLLQSLKATAPLVIRLSEDLQPLVSAAKPALRTLGASLTRGAKIAPKLVPLTKTLGDYARASLPTAQLTDQLFSNLTQTGFFANFLAFVYHAAAATARFDGTSHILPAHVAFTACSNYASSPVTGCSANYTAPAKPTTSARDARQAAAQALLRYLLR